MITVQELIEMLSKMPMDAFVYADGRYIDCIEDRDSQWFSGYSEAHESVEIILLDTTV